MNLWTGCIHSHGSAAQFRPVCCSYRLFCFSVVAHLDERKTSGLICFEIGHHLEPLNSSVLFK